MRFLFIVQGEGRGHMTQALALRSMLTRAGHTVAAALVGRSARRRIPGFFRRKIDAPIYSFASPNFVADDERRAIRLGSSVWRNTALVGAFRNSLRRIDTAVRTHRPDAIVNFFEPLAGLYNRWYAPDVPTVCIGHQYLLHHPVYPFPPEQPLQRTLVQHFTALTALGAAQKLALSFYPAQHLPEEQLTVVPPLLRDELFAQPMDEQGSFVLAYVLNAGYADELMRWNAAHPEVELHAFWDNPDVPAAYRPRPNLTFHRLHDELFLSMMARCRGLVCTAGFESVCEAMYLNKPVLMVPVEGHFEQHCNAIDAEGAGAGLRDTGFAIDRLLNHEPRTCASASFRSWVDQAEPRFLEALERAAYSGTTRIAA